MIFLDSWCCTIVRRERLTERWAFFVCVFCENAFPRDSPAIFVGATRGRQTVGPLTTALSPYPTSHQPRHANTAHLQLRLQLHEIKEARPTMDTSLFQTITDHRLGDRPVQGRPAHPWRHGDLPNLGRFIRRYPFYIDWAVVLELVCPGKWLDAQDDIATFGYWRWEASMHDVSNTSFWPTVFTPGWMVKA